MAATAWSPLADTAPRWAMVLLAVAAVALFALSPLIGSLASVVAVLLVLAATPAAFAPGWRRALVAQPGPLLLAGAFAALVVSFVITAREPADVSYALNFAALLAAPALWLLLRGADRTRLLAWTFRLCLAGALVAALVAAASVQVFGLPRAEGFIGGPNLLPRVALPLGFAAAGALLIETGSRRFIYYAGPAAAAVATLYSGSRGAIVALVVLVLVLGASMLSRRELRRDLGLIAAALLVASVGVALAVPGVGARLATIVPTMMDVVATGATTDPAMVERLADLVHAPDAFVMAPLFGWGWANMGAAVASVADRPELAALKGFFFHADLANFAVGAGSVGVAALLAILAAPLVGILAAERDTASPARLYLALMLVAGYLVLGLSDFTLGYDLPTTLYAFLTAVVIGSAGVRSS